VLFRSAVTALITTPILFQVRGGELPVDQVPEGLDIARPGAFFSNRDGLQMSKDWRECNLIFTIGVQAKP
jgi:hypothetical protein